MLHRTIAHLLVLLPLLCLAYADEGENQCVSVKVTDRCAASELDSGIDIVSWSNGVNKCTGEEECCGRSPKATMEIAKRAWKNCMASCKSTCELSGSNPHLYTATWPVKCKESCQIMSAAVHFGLFGADCPTKNEPCLADFTLDFGDFGGDENGDGSSDVPEVEICRKDPKSCSACLINKTLPNYSKKIMMCQAACTNPKPKMFGGRPMTKAALCHAHLYGQYIKFIRKSCSEPEKDKCTPDGGSGLVDGSCSSPLCAREKAKCLSDAASMIKRVSEMVANRWKESCEESCETSDEASLATCIAKGHDRQVEVESNLMSTVCSFLDVRS